MLKIDTHNHIMPSALPRFEERFGYGGFIHLEGVKGQPNRRNMMIGDTFFRQVEANCWDPEIRLKECDEYGVDVQVLCTIPVLFNYWAEAKDALVFGQYLNDHLAEVVQAQPQRFVGLCTVPLQDPKLAAQELERCMKLGYKGVQIGSHIEDMNLNDPRLFPFYEAAEKLGAAILVHPWDMMGKPRMERYWLPWLVGMPAETSLAICSMIFGGVFDRFPDMRVLFAHAGGSFPATIGRIEHGYNCRPDLVAVDNPTNPREYLGHFFVDSITHDPVMLDYVLDLIGEDKVVLGTDYPFPLGDLEHGKMIEDMDMPEARKGKIFGDNALDWLAMKAEDFS